MKSMKTVGDGVLVTDTAVVADGVVVGPTTADVMPLALVSAAVDVLPPRTACVVVGAGVLCG